MTEYIYKMDHGHNQRVRLGDQIRFPDGTQVVLGYHAELYLKDFTIKKRKP